MNLGIKRFIKDSRGAVLVEAAIVLPFMLLLLGGAAEFGRFFYTYNTLAKATRVSARYISSQCVSTGRLSSARNLAVYGNAAGTGTSILPNLTASNVVLCSPEPDGTCRPLESDDTPETITVRIDNYTYQPIIPIGPLEDLVGFEIVPSTTIKYLVTTPIVGGCS